MNATKTRTGAVVELTRHELKTLRIALNLATSHEVTFIDALRHCTDASDVNARKQARLNIERFETLWTGLIGDGIRPRK